VTRIVGIAGSLRKGSYNGLLLRAAVALMPEGAELEPASLHGIPLYDGDLEAASGTPDPVRALQERIAASDGLFLVTPEYNNSIPGVFKNAVDWLSRPSKESARVFEGKPVALAGATPGRGGTMLAQAAWLPVLRALGIRPWFGPRLFVSEAGKLFDADGRLTDATVRTQLQGFVTGFVQFVRNPAGGE